MDVIKAEIERKRRQIDTSNVLAGGKKYFKRSDLAAKQEEAYWEKHKRMKKAEEVEEEDVAVDTACSSADGKKLREKHMLPRKEVIKRLRERQEPIRLYGETDQEAYERLRKLEMLTPEMNKGFNNDMKAAMDKVDEAYLNEILRMGGETEDSKSNDVKVRDDGTTIESIQELAEGFGKGDDALDSEVILKFFKLVLKLWGVELNSRPLEEKRSFKGKLLSATHTQTVSYVKPLFKKLKRKSVTPDILGCLVDITKQMLERQYIKANDAYLEMAIGNAPWPIGVTMVGIHARTGREKIFARNVAHVLNDETQRKYIQGLKRLMTCLPTVLPPQSFPDYH